LTIEAQILRIADRVTRKLRLFQNALSAEALIGLARRHTGLSDFGREPIEEALTVLLASYHKEAELSLFGHLAAKWDVLRFLTNLLLLREAELNNPAISEERILRPIFIVGLPRSGTTFLHNLLAQDPDNLVPLFWETIYPCPDGRSLRSGRDRRPERVDRQISTFARLAPELGLIHPMTAQSPQECTEITAHVFRSLRLDTTHHVPSYRQWLDRTGHLAAYRFHKHFLQYLQHQKGPGCWILKCPDHVFALDTIRLVYPDARFIILHRDPVKVLSSVARLTEVLRLPFTRHIDRREIGRQVNQHWQRGAALLIEADANGLASPSNLRHVEFRDFIADPFRTVSTLYSHFDLGLTSAAASRIKNFIAQRPNGGYGRGAGRLEDYGLSAPALREAYQPYMKHFGIESEAGVASGSDSNRILSVPTRAVRQSP
jgi:hypothetical protein